MAILITGASGFIGRHFVEYATEKYGRENLVLLTRDNIPGYNCILHRYYSFTKDDFLNAGIENIDIVFHIGGCTPKNASENTVSNLSSLSKNLSYTVHLLENLPSVPKKFIYISSVSVYAQSEEPVSEETNYTDNDLYGISKLMTEFYLQECAKKEGFALQILRLGQIYGEGEEKYSKIISSFLNKLIEKQQIIVWGDGSVIRSNLYVKDVVRYIYEASLLVNPHAPINICSKQAVSIKELIEICSDVVGVDYMNYVRFDNTRKAGNITYNTARQETIFPNIVETPIEKGINNLYLYLKDKHGRC